MSYITIIPCSQLGCRACQSLALAENFSVDKILEQSEGYPYVQCDGTITSYNLQQLQDAAQKRIAFPHIKCFALQQIGFFTYPQIGFFAHQCIEFFALPQIDQRIYTLLRDIQKICEDALTRLNTRKRKSDGDSIPPAKIHKSEHVAQECPNTRKRKSEEDSLPPAKIHKSEKIP